MHQSGSIGQGSQQLHELKDVLKTQSHRSKHHWRLFKATLQDGLFFPQCLETDLLNLLLIVESYVQLQCGKKISGHFFGACIAVIAP